MTFALGSSRRRGFTLVEVLVAVGILAIVSATSVAGMLYSARLGRSAVDDMIAIEFLNRETELVRTHRDYAGLGTDAVPRFRGTRRGVYDEQFADNGFVWEMEYLWWGFGEIQSTTSTSITIVEPEDDWPDVDIVGRRVVIRPNRMGAGVGGGQIANIADWDAEGGVIRTDFGVNGFNSSEWWIQPAAGDLFEVDGGKHLRLTMRWARTARDLDRPERRSERVREIFVPFRPPSGGGAAN